MSNTPFFKTDCPSCGAPVEAHSASAVTLVCGYCNSMLVRQDDGIVDSGRDSALLEDFSPLQIGTTGTFVTQRFTLVGRLQVQYDDGAWNEWYALFDDGRTGWLSEAGDLYVMTMPVETDNPPRFEDIRAGFSELTFQNKRYVASDVRHISLKRAAAQGELPFVLNEEKIRISNTSLLIEAIREALVNTLIHADYLQNFPKVKIEMFDGWINFENSGKMLITKDEYIQGGNSVIRNETLVQLVRLIGIAERQGFGGVKICKTSETLFKQQPEITTDFRETKLKLWTVDALHFREDLSVLDRTIYYILLKNNHPLTRKEIISISKNTEHFIKKSLTNLLVKGLIATIGNGRSTKYEISFGTQGYLTKIQMKLQTLAKLNNLFSED